MHGFTMSLQSYQDQLMHHGLKCLTNTAIANYPLTSPKDRRQITSLQIHKTSTDRLRFVHVASNGSLTLCAQRLQGLFHSLSRVLFIFRSHYLFTIGLGAIFSLRRSTPAALHSTIKLRDSWSPQGSATPTRAYRSNGTFALLGHTVRCGFSDCVVGSLPSALALQFHSFRFLPLRIRA